MVLKLSKLPVSFLPFLKEMGRRDLNYTLLFSEITDIKWYVLWPWKCIKSYEQETGSGVEQKH